MKAPWKALMERGISAKTAEEAGIYAAEEAEVKAILGYGGCGPGLVIPYPGTDYQRVRIDSPGPDGKRYRSPKGSTNRLYVPPKIGHEFLQDASAPLYFTESEFKALKATQEGFPAVAVAGVWSWRRRLHGESLEIPDLDRVTWLNRHVILVFDSDAANKPPVQWAEFHLARALKARGARVSVIRLPDSPDGDKYGLDDFLAQHGPEAFRALEMVSVDEADAEGPAYLRMSDLARAYMVQATEPVSSIVRTGYSVIDATIRGIAPGENLVILGRSGVGKTAFGLNLLRKMHERGGFPTLFFSLEQPGVQIFERVVSLESGLTGRDILERARLRDEGLAQWFDASCERWDQVVTVDRPCSLAEVDTLVSGATTAGLWPAPVRLVMIDYLGMLTPDRRGTTYEVVSELSREIKRLAKRLRVAVIVLCQVGRSGESGGKPVTLQSARDSGVVEESADYVLGVWRPELDDALKDEDRAEVRGVFKGRVLKNRSGPAPVPFELRFDHETLRIEEEVLA